MKKSIVIIALLILSTFQALAQQRDFDGLWAGTMDSSDEDTYSIIIYIEDNNVYAVTFDADDDPIKDRSKEIQMSKGFGEQLNFFWINTGEEWTETQMYSLSWKSETELSLYHVRHVSNKTEDGNGNTDWGYFGTGTLSKQ